MFKQVLYPIVNFVTRFLYRTILGKTIAPSVDDLRYATLSFSQFGEDVFINKCLEKKKTRGIYIDIGAFHPKLFSLTYLLYLKGYSGIVIDANPGLVAQFKKERPRDNVILSAVGARETFAFYAEYDDPAANRLVFDNNEKSLTGLTPKKMTKVKVDAPMKLLERVNTAIDLLNIDCEGLDFQILKEIDLEKLAPYLISIEAHDHEQVTAIESYLSLKKYHLIGKFKFTYIFQKKSAI